MKNAWMVRAGEGSEAYDDFESGEYVAIGWNELGDLAKIKGREQLRTMMDKAYPQWKPRKRAVSVGMVGRFLFDIKKGDPVVSYDTDTRRYIVGEVSGDYEYRPKQSLGQSRAVKWKGKVDRDSLSVGTRNTLGAIQTLFALGPGAWEEMGKVMAGGGQASEATEQEAEVDSLRLEVIGRSHEFIKDQVLKLDWDEMQDLMAGILRAMGYKTKVSPKGGDRGKDIIASPDGLGLEQPRIRAEVKHRPGSQMGSNDLRSFLGGLRDSDKGIYVSTGGFTKEANYEAERSNIPIVLIDSDALVSLLLQHYESADTQTRTLVPLTRVYWPAG